MLSMIPFPHCDLLSPPETVAGWRSPNRAKQSLIVSADRRCPTQNDGAESGKSERERAGWTLTLNFYAPFFGKKRSSLVVHSHAKSLSKVT